MTQDDIYSVQILKVGEIECPSPGVRAMQDLGQWEPFCYTMVVARSLGRTVVINAGFPDDPSAAKASWMAMDPRCELKRPDSMKVENQLARVGISPDSVDDFILSPIGPYSTGKASLFSKACIHIGKTEWLDFQCPPPGVPFQPREVVFPPSVLLDLLYRDWGRISFIEDEGFVLPGIRAFRVGGHHKGSLAIVIRTAAGEVAYTDGIFTWANFTQNIPPGWCRSTDDFHASVQRIRREGLILIPAFEPRLFEKYPDGVVVSP